ncbi:MAG: hypothetical protein HYS20_15035 [Rhodocyclales bacterium]|nr:hypothetical protein [Rhodocyclales bacterium]
MSDIYASPAAALDLPREDPSESGSLERGIAGDYTFTIGEVLKEAWERTNGAKLTLNLAMLAYGVITIVATMITNFAFGGLLTAQQGEMSGLTIIGGAIVQQLVILAVVLPPMIGMLILGLRRAVGAPIAVGQVLRHYHRTLPLLGGNILMTIAIIIGMVLLVIPGIYLSVALLFTLALVAEKGLGPLAAMSASRKAVHKRWFSFLGFGLVLTLINMVAAIPLGIGLIWSMPFTFIATGVLYNRIFGCEAETRA